jgi:major membrane immunogen (membrane-anchored lipoprotein)
MARFTTRVELHDEKSGDYPKLHEQMEKRGFTRTITVKQKTYKLPDASYNYVDDNGSLGEEDIFDKAKAATDAINREAGIVVTKSDGRFVGGLELA